MRKNMKRNLVVVGVITLLLTACGGSPTESASVPSTKAPDFILPNALGGEVSLSDYEGQPVFLFFHMAVG
jgi:cytochrome oxidase Cu insertion factor (SCO1/SenC/PrrC family)